MTASQMDPTRLIDENIWCVTIFTKNGGHAELIIEGVKDGRKFSTRAHLTGTGSRSSDMVISHDGYGKVEITDLTGKAIQYKSKSQTWVATRDKVQNILNEADHDMREPNRTPFAVFGSNSYLVLDNYKLVRNIKGIFTQNPQNPRESCISWCFHKVRLIDVKRPFNPLDFLITATPLYLKA